ncbi:MULTISPECIES: hypothetical protein [Pseudomonas]|nr:hypothetical protein [Pseudomonas putida]
MHTSNGVMNNMIDTGDQKRQQDNDGNDASATDERAVFRRRVQE